MTGTPSWRELLSTLGETFNGCTTQGVIDSEGRPEAAAWLNDEGQIVVTLPGD